MADKQRTSLTIAGSAKSGGVVTAGDSSSKEGDIATTTNNNSKSSVGRVPEALAQQSVEGWVVVATGIHEEAREDDVHDFFGAYGRVSTLHLNLDRQTGYAKGYALVEYTSFDDARRAVDEAPATKLLGLPVAVDFAFVKDDDGRRSGRRSSADGNTTSSGSRRRPPPAERSREESPDRGF
ncbi:hypothetical protein H4217_005515 [Coemansia sp. RSA 1939]|nr:hypothetical protein H4217_005515 [Coemansia sp. RSA 1939]KAJ2594455.1 hypothetical protein EV177_008362 [Coemansia sp. RSA 1804]KAJ2688308.1 hypothetical protein GGH99_003062 [Coemansia sp. RSA 1285]